jgi:hypothetical protein
MQNNFSKMDSSQKQELFITSLPNEEAPKGRKTQAQGETLRVKGCITPAQGKTSQ